MKENIKLKRKDGKIVNGKFIFLSKEYIDKIMIFQDEIYKGLKDKQLYSMGTEEEFLEAIEEKGKVLGCIDEDNNLIGIGVYCRFGYEEHNYGYDIELSGEELLKVGQIESTLVKEEYRGNRLQKQICEILEQVGIEDNVSIICATASPYNEFSVNTFVNLGYKIMKDKIKYGGLRRYVFMKIL